MSLDRQRILSELGSVMNQLQSADCGCMGKLFSDQNPNPNQNATMGSPLPTCGGCRRGCCHGHGYNYGTPCAGEPHSMNHGMNQPCMGRCNPPKLYADTYSYLNNNLMQPVMNEVYSDLKSLNSGNTVMNSPLANQMGIPQGNTGNMQENAQNDAMGMQNMGGMESTNANSMAMAQSGQPVNAMGGMGGMGPEIVKMIMGEGGSKPSNPKGMMQRGQLNGPTVIDAPQSPHGQIGLTPFNPMAGNSGQQGQNSGSFNQQENMDSNFSQHPTTQYMAQPTNMYSGTTRQGNPMMNQIGQNGMQQGAPQMGNLSNGMVSGTSQMSSGNLNAQQNMTPPTNQYGQHTQGVMKFNEMFPGVMQGGDLGFDPMAIAIQMNPSNKQKAAMDTMQKMMTSGPMSRAMDHSVMKPVMDATKTAVQSVNPPNAAPVGQPRQNIAYGNQMGHQQMPAAQQNNMNANQQMITGQQQKVNQNTGVVSSNMVPQQQQQQVYTAATGSPVPNQQLSQQQQMHAYQQQSIPTQQYQQPQTQYITDPNTGATSTSPIMPGYMEGTINPNPQMQSPPSGQSEPQTMSTPQPMFREPIFPADTSRSKPYTYSKPTNNFEYNTLGQPVEMYPAKMFHVPDPGLPQTLSPQPPTKHRNDYMKYSNVKSTVSKTSLMGNKPTGRTPSRSQLQHVYNQYKGSQSFTQQNVRPPVQGGSNSAGKINVPPTNTNQPQQVPVERVGGDSVANDQLANNNFVPVKEQQMGQNMMGDVPVPNKPQGDAPMKPSSPVPTRHAKLRNGLQDVVYTSYPSSAAWTFHGTNTYRPVASGGGHRFRFR